MAAPFPVARSYSHSRSLQLLLVFPSSVHARKTASFRRRRPLGRSARTGFSFLTQCTCAASGAVGGAGAARGMGELWLLRSTRRRRKKLAATAVTGNGYSCGRQETERPSAAVSGGATGQREMCRSMYRGKLRREVYVSYAFENESDVYVH